MPRTYSICFLFFNIAALVEGKYFRTDYTYRFPPLEAWFKIHVIPATWFEANLRCHNEGAVLASPENRLMLHAMRHILTATKMSSSIFTGIHATYSNGDYFTVQGTPFSEIQKFVSWAPNEPDNRNNGEDTLIMLPDGTMADAPSSNIYPYICFKERTNLVPSDCGTLDTSYTLDPETGSCYKFHNEPKTWSRAFSVCAGEGGYLAVINNNTEAQVLQRLFANHFHTIQGDFYKNKAFIGFGDFNQQGFWMTVHGQSLQEAGYDKWTKNEPSYDSQKNCGGIQLDGTLTAHKCEYRYVFICEKNPSSLMADDEEYIMENIHENND